MLISHKKELIWGLGLFVLLFFSFGGFSRFISGQIDSVSVLQMATVYEPTIPKEEKIEKDVANIKLAFVGDMMFDRGVKASVYKNFGGDYAGLFSEVENKLKKYDLLVGNLEGPISDKGADIGGQYSFRFEPKVVTALKDAGFDVLSLANNHTYNWDEPAFTDTMKLLSEAGIAYTGGGFAGSEVYRGKVTDTQNIRLAFLAFSEFRAGGINSSSTQSGLAIISEKEIKESVSRVKNNSDLVIVSLHFGEEYQTKPNLYQRKYAELAIDSGADLIIGHHPHVVQTLEQYKNVYIIYSLGNFIFDQYFSTETMQGGLLEVEVDPVNKRIEKVALKKVLLNKYYQIESIE